MDEPDIASGDAELGFLLSDSSFIECSSLKLAEWPGHTLDQEITDSHGLLCVSVAGA